MDGVPLSDLLARRDCRKGKLGVLRNFLDNASELVSRRTVGEIRIRSTVDVRSMQKEVDRMSRSCGSWMRKFRRQTGPPTYFS